jgi:hypothetical protein
MNSTYISPLTKQALDIFKQYKTSTDLSSVIVSKSNLDLLKIPLKDTMGNYDSFILNHFEQKEGLKTWNESEIIWLLESTKTVEESFRYVIPYKIHGTLFYFTKEKNSSTILIKHTEGLLLKHLSFPILLLLKLK